MNGYHSFNVKLAQLFGVNEAIILANIHYWCELNKKKENKNSLHEGRWWTYNSYKAFTDIFPYFTADQIRRSLQKLIKAELLLVGNFNKLGGDRTNWYTLSDKCIEIMSDSARVDDLRENQDNTENTTQSTPSGRIAKSNWQNCQIELAELPNRTGRIAKAIPDINTNLKTTAAEKNINDNNQDKKIAAVSLLKNKITELFGDSEILTNDFYEALLNNSKLYPDDYTEYLDWAYNKVKASSPDDIAKYFYKVASKTYYVTNFYASKLSESKNLQQENKKNTGMYTCPVCGKSHLYSDDCPECGLKFDDRQPENIEMQKIKYKYGSEVYDRLIKELETEKNKIMPEFSFTKNSVWIKKQKEIIAKYI